MIGQNKIRLKKEKDMGTDRQTDRQAMALTDRQHASRFGNS